MPRGACYSTVEIETITRSTIITQRYQTKSALPSKNFVVINFQIFVHLIRSKVTTWTNLKVYCTFVFVAAAIQVLVCQFSPVKESHQI